jgi:hypothetical protein
MMCTTLCTAARSLVPQAFVRIYLPCAISEMCWRPPVENARAILASADAWTRSFGTSTCASSASLRPCTVSVSFR